LLPAISQSDHRVRLPISRTICSCALAYKPKDDSQYDTALLNWRTRKVRKLTSEQQPGYSWRVVAWRTSDDKAIYAVRVNRLFTDADVYRIDVSPERWRISPSDLD